MTKISYSLVLLPTLLGALLSTPAQAQRVFVAAAGSDSNPCTFASPCRSFQHAHDIAAANGEIDVLDPAGYGVLTITKAISIQGHGYSGLTVPSSGTGITINAGSADEINLNGLIIDGAGVGLTGIAFNTGKSLTIKNSFVRKFANSAIIFAPSVSSSLIVSDTIITSSGGNGIYVGQTASASVTAIFDRVEADNNGSGIYVDGSLGAGTLSATATNTVVTGNALDGFASVSSSAITNLMVFRSVAANNNVGILTLGSAAPTVRLGQSTVTGNATGWCCSNVLSYGDNKIDGNISGNTAPPSIPNK